MPQTKFQVGAWTLAALLGLVPLSGCEHGQAGADSPGASRTGATDSAGAGAASAGAGSGNAWLTEVSAQLGIKNPPGPYADGTFKTPEITPGGVALFDYDNDGRLDILQVVHAAPGAFETPAPDRLWHQEADGTFKEVPDAAGLNDPGFGHGVAVGDIDNDGDLDVYITNYGVNHLYRNDGGRFVDVTQPAGLEAPFAWSSSAAFFDYDRDGFLDLWVCRFATFDPNKKCNASQNPSDLDYCGPHVFPGLLPSLYHNNGDGTFTEVTAKAGIEVTSRSWGVAIADLDGDGWQDVYIANDEEAAQLWQNQHDGTFRDVAPERGAAYNMRGRHEAGMGLAVGDVDGNGTLDLFKTHITSETNTLYRNLGTDFQDSTAESTMGSVSRAFTGWGTGMVDFDHDGDLDIAIVNGRVARGPLRPNAKLGKFWNQFAEPKLLFENDGHAVFTNISAKTGHFGAEPEVSRGAAFGDIDNDGDIDIVVGNLDNTLRIFRNDFPKQGRHWLIARLMTGKRDANGAVATIRAGGQRYVRQAHPGYSFLSSNDPRLHVGLDKADHIDSFLVRWPDGSYESFAIDRVDQAITLRQGEGKQGSGDEVAQE